MFSVNSAHARIEILPSNILLFIWQGDTQDSAELHHMASELLQTSERFKSTKWIIDLSGMNAMQQDDQHWLLSDWHEACISFKITHIALLPSESLDDLMAIEQLIKQTAKSMNFDVQFFDNRTEALIWIENN